MFQIQYVLNYDSLKQWLNEEVTGIMLASDVYTSYKKHYMKISYQYIDSHNM